MNRPINESIIDQLGISLFKFLKYIAVVLKIISPDENISIKLEPFDKEDFFFETKEYIKDIKMHIKPGKTAEGMRKIPRKNIFWKFIVSETLSLNLFNFKFIIIYNSCNLFLINNNYFKRYI